MDRSYANELLNVVCNETMKMNLCDTVLRVLTKCINQLHTGVRNSKSKSLEIALLKYPTKFFKLDILTF